MMKFLWMILLTHLCIGCSQNSQEQSKAAPYNAKTIPTGKGPDGIGISKVYSYDAKTYRKLDTEYTVEQKPIGVVSALEDSKLYVTNYGDNVVSVIQK